MKVINLSIFKTEFKEGDRSANFVRRRSDKD